MHLNVASFHQMVIVENAKDARRTDCGMRISDCGLKEEKAEGSQSESSVSCLPPAFSSSESAIRNPHSAIGTARVLRVFNDDHLVKRRDV